MTEYAGSFIVGISTDTKPAKPDGWRFLEADTGNKFQRRGGVWESIPCNFGGGTGGGSLVDEEGQKPTGAVEGTTCYVRSTDKYYVRTSTSWTLLNSTGGGSPPTGTGWVHVTSGVQDGAASTPTAAQTGADESGAAADAFYYHEGQHDHSLLHNGGTQDTAIAGKTTLSAVKADTDIADALTKKHANTLDHNGGTQDTALTTHGNLTTTAHGGIPVAHARANGLAVYAALANDTLAQNYAVNSVTKLTVTAARTLTTTVPAAGVQAHTIILTSGTTSYVITFGTGFKPTGTLATGTTAARVFVVHWISDGANLYESGRTAAMVA